MNRNFFSAHSVWLVLLATLCISACKPSAPQTPGSQDPKVSGDSIVFPGDAPVLQHIETAAVTPAQPRDIELPGRLVWDEDHTARLMPPVNGRFSEASAHGELGAAVKANDALGWLVSPDIGTAQSEFATAQAAYEQAEKAELRAKGLREVNGVSGKDLEQAEADLQRARAERDRAQLHLKVLGAAKAIDQRFAIRSPVAGIVVERNTNPGMEWRTDQPGAALFVVTDPAYLWCWIDAPEAQLPLLHVGMDVSVHSSAWPKQVFTAQVDYIGDALDPVSRTVRVRARLHNPDRHLKGEMYVTATVAGEAVGNIDIPGKAVFLNNRVQQVFVKTATGTFTRKTIVPVASTAQWITIADGLKPDDQVVVDGALYLEQILEDAQSNAAATVAVTAPAKPST